MTLFGHAENGVIVLEGRPTIPDGTRVRVELPDTVELQNMAEKQRPMLKRLLTEEELPESLKQFIGIIPPEVDIEALLADPERFGSHEGSH